MARVYLETSFVSACVTTRRDGKSIYRREASREWWDLQRHRHELFASAEVVEELSDPRYPQSEEAHQWIADVPLLPLNDEVLGFAEILVRERVTPAPVGGDSVHLAAACVHRMQYVLSWNVRHLANRNKVVHLRTICLRAGLLAPEILTPDLLWEEYDDGP